MSVIAVGLNHQSAPLDVLGEMAIPADRWPKLLTEVLSGECINEAVVLSTCNRTEVYVDAERFHDAYHVVRDALAIVAEADPARFVPHLYVYYEDDAVKHLFSVVAGLDSIILGEHEILGQFRTAYDVAKASGSLGPVLSVLGRHAVSVGRKVRSATDIGTHTASLSHASLDALGDLGFEVDGVRVLLVGTGEAGSALATALVKRASVDLTIVNRTRSRAEQLAEGLGAEVVDFEHRSKVAREADLIISATTAPNAVLDVGDLADRTEPVVIVDLAVPADVSPELRDDPRTSVVSLATVQRRANQGIEHRQREAVAARELVADAMVAYEEAARVRGVEPLLGSLHRWADGVRSSEIDRYRNRLGELDVEQLEAVEALTKAVVAKMLHQPSVSLRDRAGSTRGERLAEAARELFGIQ